MTNRKIWFWLLVGMAFLVLPGCVTINISAQAPPPVQTPQPIRPADAETIGDLAFNGDYKKDITVYVNEGSSYEPFLVISGNYNGNALLLRKNVTDYYMPYRDETLRGSKGSYYPKSDVDAYLNDIYFTSLPPALQEIILDTTISVATVESVSGGGAPAKRETEIVTRKIFLLSATELGIRSNMTCKEGTALKYFSDDDKRAATKANGEPGDWWLRSAHLWNDIRAWVVGSGSDYGAEGIAFELGLRPAFTVDNETPVKESEELIDGKHVFVLG